LPVWCCDHPVSRVERNLGKLLRLNRGEGLFRKVSSYFDTSEYKFEGGF